MNLLESALMQILGYYPTYMRPPYFSTNDLVLQTMTELGYHVIQAGIDTLDWANDSEVGIQTSVQNFKNGLDAGGSLELSHDVHQWTANVLVQAMIDEINRRGLRGMIVSLSLILFVCELMIGSCARRRMSRRDTRPMVSDKLAVDGRGNGKYSGSRRSNIIQVLVMLCCHLLPNPRRGFSIKFQGLLSSLSYHLLLTS